MEQPFSSDLHRFLAGAISAAATGSGGDTPSTGGVLPCRQSTSMRLWQSAANEGVFLRQANAGPDGPWASSVSAVRLSTKPAGQMAVAFGAAYPWRGSTKATRSRPAKPKLKLLKLQPKKLAGVIHATTEIADDAAAFASWLELAFARESAFILEDALINGSGSGQPLGVMNSGALITISKESGQSAQTVNAANIAGMVSRLWPGSQLKAIWLANQELRSQLWQMTIASGTSNVPLFQPSALAGEPPTLAGLPCYFHEAAAAPGSAGDILLLDPAEILVANRGGQMLTSIHLKFLVDEEAIRFTMKVDGQPAWNTPVVPFKGNVANTLSPFIALETRA